jgi:hypothetical protein
VNTACALLDRDPAAHVDVSDPVAVARLLDALREAGAYDQTEALLARDPAGHADLRNPGAVALLLGAPGWSAARRQGIRAIIGAR